MLRQLSYQLILVLIGFFSRASAQPTLLWAKSIGGASGDQGLSTATDASGNVYTTGKYAGTSDFDPGAGVFNLTSAGVSDIFVSKLDASGNFVWAKSMGGTGNPDEGHSIAVDVSGNVYITGQFVGTADFDPGAGTFNLTASGATDIFVSKLDAVGNFVWAVRFGSSSLTTVEGGNSIAVDGSGNVYTTGAFIGTVDFDPGAGTFNLVGSGAMDVFISKLDAAGNFVWAKGLIGANTSKGNSIAVDGSSNVYTTGSFAVTVDFDPGAGTANLTSAGGDDIFVSKLDASGNYLWGTRMGGATNTDIGEGIAVDGSGNVYTTGHFGSAPSDFNPGAGTFNMSPIGGSLYDIFISKLNSAGTFVWAKQIGGSGSEFGASIALDGSANVYIIGDMNSVSMDADPNAGVVTVSNSGFVATFIGKYDAAGNYLCAFTITPGQIQTGSGSSSGNTGDRFIAINGSSVYITGWFDALTAPDFDPCGPNVYNVSSYGGIDVPVVKYDMSTCGGGCLILPIELISFEVHCTEHNNVRLQWQTATETNNDFFTIERSTDGVNFEPVGMIKGAGNSNIMRNYQYMDATPNPPVVEQALEPQTSNTLYYRLKQTDFDGQFEYFDVVAVKNCEQKKETFNIYPNPANHSFSFMIQESNEDLLLEVYNHLGARVIHQAYFNLENGAQHTIETNKLAQGIYLVKFSQGINRQTSKLIINR